MVFSSLLPTADQIDRWADSRAAEASLPRLVRRLITATTTPSWLEIGAGVAVRFPGWDGHLQVPTGNAWVPTGVSFWEMGTNADVRDKAQRDYRKRTDETPDEIREGSTFVFVSPRHWQDRDDWLKDRRNERRWAAVEALDASNLEAWLETAPHVHLWLSQELDARVVGTRSLEDWWDEWADWSRPYRFPADLLLRGRQTQAERLLEWLAAAPDAHVLRAATVDEATAFLAAVLTTPDSDTNDRLLRSVVVANAEAWRQLIVVPRPLILIPEFPNPWIGKATDRGHHVIVPAGPDDPVTPELELATRSEDDIASGLASAFGIDPRNASDLAAAAAGSLKALRRSLSRVDEFNRPPWTDPGQAGLLAPALLVGSWDRGLEGDRRILATVAQREYEALEADLLALAAETDPPVRQRGSVWVTVDRRDLWLLLRDSVPEATWQEFSNATQTVLGGEDPALDLAPTERWMANALGKQRPHSQRLRDGFASTLAMLGGWGPLMHFGTGRSGPEFASAATARILASVNEDPAGGGWISLGSVLPMLAEAAPVPFLLAARAGLAGDRPVLGSLLASADEGGVFASSPQAPILWGLEALAWSPDLLVDVARILRDWAAIDPGGRTSNRPANSFRQIFLPWHPQTASSTDGRLAALRTTRAEDRDAAWPLLRELLPKPNDLTGETAKPRWREWAREGTPNVARTEYIYVVGEIMTMLLEDSGANGAHWASLIEAYDDLPEGLGERVVEGLAAVANLGPDDASRERIADAIRSVSSRHRAHRDAKWALPLERLEPLERLAPTFAPADLVLRYRWLFHHHPDSAAISGGSYETYDDQLRDRRAKALAEIVGTGGTRDITRLAELSEYPESVGWTAGVADVAGLEVLDWAASGDESTRRAAAGFVRASVSVHGPKWMADWIRERGRGVLTDQQLADLVAALPPRPSTWDLAASLGRVVEGSYWHSFAGYPSGEDALVAARMLIQYGRPYEALDLVGAGLQANKAPFDRDVVLDALELATTTSPPVGHTLSMFAHVLPDLLDRLHAEGTELGRIARFEWTYLGVFEDREAAPRRLSHALASIPEFFVELIVAAFRGSTEEPRATIDEQEVNRARQAYRLLTLWKEVPGSQDGTINGALLDGWIDTARRLLAEVDRVAIGDQQIGQILWWSPVGEDGLRPHETVRDAIERVASDELERGFVIAALNSRGAHFRTSRNGDDERTIAAEFEANAMALQRWPRTAKALSDVATSYLRDAERNDAEASLEEIDQAEREPRSKQT